MKKIFALSTILILITCQNDELKYQFDGEYYSIYKNKNSVKLDTLFNVKEITSNSFKPLSLIVNENNIYRVKWNNDLGSYLIVFDDEFKVRHIESTDNPLSYRIQFGSFSKDQKLFNLFAPAKVNNNYYLLQSASIIFNNSKIDTLRSVFYHYSSLDSVIHFYNYVEDSIEYEYEIFVFEGHLADLSPYEKYNNIYVSNEVTPYLHLHRDKFDSYSLPAKAETSYTVMEYKYFKGSDQIVDYNLIVVDPVYANFDFVMAFKFEYEESLKEFENDMNINLIKEDVESFPFLKLDGKVLKVDKNYLHKLIDR